MTRRRREIETLLLTAFAAVPLYFTHAVAVPAILLFHAAILGIAVRVALGKGPELVPLPVMKALALAYIPFYVVDVAMISRSAIAASTHLVLFIAVYQPIESLRTHNQAQRLLTTALIFVASLATSTHITVVLFVIGFAYLGFRQLMYVSHMETVRSIGEEYGEAPSGRAAIFYLTTASLFGALMFPLMPRVKNPLLQGLTGSLSSASTGLSESINLNEPRSSSPDPTIVARVWMSPEAVPFFTPLRLRGTVYDRYARGSWVQSYRGLRDVDGRDGTYEIARPTGFKRIATVQQRPLKGRIFLPVGTYALSGVPNLFEGPTRESYYVFQIRPGEILNIQTSIAWQTEPLRVQRVNTSRYPVTTPVMAMAQRIVGRETRPERQAALIERYLSRNFTYVQDPSTLGNPMSVDDFLLKRRKGHCEYFAAGMVALMTSLDVPARIAGGFYGGRLNPLTGYFTIRREDAHAWVEVWDGARWLTFDPTPAALRPGSQDANVFGVYASALGDSINYFWDRYILTYGVADQVALAVDVITSLRNTMAAAKRNVEESAKEIASPRYLGLLGLIVVCGIIAVLIAHRRPALFDLLATHLAKLGIVVGPAMTMEEALAELRAKHPDAARELEPLIALYEEERFSARHDRTRVDVIRRRLKNVVSG